MPLSQIATNFPTLSIAVGANAFTVRGVTTDDIGQVIAKHGSEFVAAVTEFKELRAKAKGEGSDEDVMKVLTVAATRFPKLFASLIATAADEPDQDVTFAKLPIGVQLEAALAVFNLTFRDGADLKNFAQNLNATLAKMGQ